MANLPRWIDSPRVDSSAMLAAFLEFRGRRRAPSPSGSPSLSLALTGTDLAQPVDAGTADPYDSLYLIKHRAAEYVMVHGVLLKPTEIPSSIPEQACHDTGCARCAELRGGYQFRWYSTPWKEAYIRTKRPGAWAPGEPEEGPLRPASTGPSCVLGVVGDRAPVQRRMEQGETPTGAGGAGAGP